ncbi:MAG: sugar porter family MFS transporter [Prolixibacteraceae bacterium]|nr:sugar porter family MFS transporter [Prolixibacteraceae bacterium]
MAKKNYILLISLIAALGGLLFGFDIAIVAGTVPFLEKHFSLSEAQLGWTVASLYVGCIIGSFSTGYLTDRFGRKIPLIIAAAIFVVSSVFMGWSPTQNMLIVWRMIAGIGVGAASMLSPLYIAEVSPANVRGKMVSINQLTIVIGILIAYSSNYFLSGIENNWRWMFTSGAAPSLLFVISAFFLPESPRWLISKGKIENAKIILGKTISLQKANDEIIAIQANLKSEIKGRISDILKKGVAPVVLLGITMAVFQQISGANAVFFYAPKIFEKAGMNISDQLFQQILIGCINLIFTLVSMQLVDRIGRKKLMLFGSSFMALWLLVISIFFHFSFFEGYWLTIVVLAFVATYATTLAPVTWVYISELFPTRIRGISISLATGMLWVACFLLTYLFPILIENLKATQTFLLFAAICFIYFLILLKFAPETKGKTLEEVESGL